MHHLLFMMIGDVEAETSLVVEDVEIDSEIPTKSEGSFLRAGEADDDSRRRRPSNF